MPRPERDVDVVVLGTGAAGLTAALTASSQGAEVALLEKSATVGGTSAVSGGLVWVPAHDRSPELDLPVDDAMAYLEAQALGTMDDKLVRVFVETAPEMANFVEQHSPTRFEIAEGFPDYKPELPGGKSMGGRSIGPRPFDLADLGEWADLITRFPEDFSNVGFDAETRARLHAGTDSTSRSCVAGTALVAGLLKGVLDNGVMPQVGVRARRLELEDGRVRSVVIDHDGMTSTIRARHGVVIATGGFEWNEDLVRTFLRGPMRGPVSPPNNVGDGLVMAMEHGAALSNMGEAWWVPTVHIPGDTIEGQPRHRSVRLERTRPRSIMVNRLGARFVNEACDYNSMAGAFHYLHPRDGYVNDPGWIVFDAAHLARYGFLGVTADDETPEWFSASPDLESLARTTGIDADGLQETVRRWNASVAADTDPDFGRGASAYDGWWGDENASTFAGRTLGPIDTPPFHAVPLTAGAMGTKGGPSVDRDGRVLHVMGGVIPGLWAAGNAMGGVTGRAYGGAGGTLAPAMTWGYRAGLSAARGD